MKRILQSEKIHVLSNIFCASSHRDSNNCIDTNSTGVSFYDDFLDPKWTKYLSDKKNLKGHIEYMTPLEYYQECASKVFNTTVKSLQTQRTNDPESINYLTKELDKGRKFSLPYINYAQKGQEGLHRMMVLAFKYGWDEVSFPVLVVEFVDPRRDEVDIATKTLQKATDEALTYKYPDSNLPYDLISEIQFQLDNDEENEYTAKCLKENNESYFLSLVGFESEIALEVFKDSIQIRQSDPDFDIEDDDLDIDLDDLEDPDDFLRKLGV